MLCTFCGTENRPEHKFCGMCGVRLERRKEQRRVRQSSGTLTCQACGGANDSETKFCGMCGLRVERRFGERRASSEAAAVRANAIANAQLPTPDAPGRRSESGPASLDVLAPPPEEEIEARRAAETIFHSRPSMPTTIGGPSFLGLGNDPESGQIQYLLEDESSSGSNRGLIFLVILILIGGLAYMGYRSGYFANLQASTAKPPATAVPAPQANPLASSSSSKGTTAAPVDPPAEASASPSADALAGEAKDKQPSADVPNNQGNPTTSSANSLPVDDNPAASASTSASASTTTSSSSKTAREISPPAKRKPSMALIQAQNYLQGRGGVHQDCDQGLIYLKAATEKNDPAAAVQMGALYASGHCVQQDRVMAYRWFNSAHELDPANPWIQTNLDQLWAQMAPQERKQVAR